MLEIIFYDLFLCNSFKDALATTGSLLYLCAVVTGRGNYLICFLSVFAKEQSLQKDKKEEEFFFYAVCILQNNLKNVRIIFPKNTNTKKR